jgi:hypothetical protein
MTLELEYHKAYSLEQIVMAFRRSYTGVPSGTRQRLFDLIISDHTETPLSDDSFCLYAEDGLAPLAKDIVCYLDRYPKVVDDEDVYPQFVLDNSLELLYYGDQFEDVMFNLLEQKEEPLIEDFISALNYYLDNDAFITYEDY